METKKTKTTAKSKKDPESEDAVKKNNITTSNYEPGKEEIRIKAKEIYLERLARNEQGTSEDDWHKAERLLKSKKR